MITDMSTSNTVLAVLENGVLTLTLNRPEKLNAFNEEMHMALRSHIERAHDDEEIRAVLLTGAGRAFCSGQDLGDRDPRKGGKRPDLSNTLGALYHPTQKLIRDLEKPVVCAVNGAAAGSGVNMALTCDIVIAAKSAKFIQSFSRLGLVPDAGGTWWLARNLGEPRAKALAMTAEPLPAEKAAEWGLIWKAVEDDLLMAEATHLAEKLAEGPPISHALTKRLIHAAATNDFDAHLKQERDCQRMAGFSDDYAEGVTAFLEKRRPFFKGR